MASQDDARHDYADENLPVFLLLGLVSALRRLEPLLPQVEPLPAAPPPAASTVPPGPPGTGRLLHLVLGLIAFRQHLRAMLTPLQEPPTVSGLRDPGSGASRPAGEAPRPPSLRELLR